MAFKMVTLTMFMFSTDVDIRKGYIQIQPPNIFCSQTNISCYRMKDEIDTKHKKKEDSLFTK